MVFTVEQLETYQYILHANEGGKLQYYFTSGPQKDVYIIGQYCWMKLVDDEPVAIGQLTDSEGNTVYRPWKVK